MAATNRTPATLLESLQASLMAATRQSAGETPPAAILWPDADGQWLPLVEPLRKLMPQLLVLGEYEPERRRGPAIWIRCVVERALPDVAIPDGVTPIVYLPGVGRQTLRAVEECPPALKPLVELQYRGAIWCQRNGRDWTVEAFLVADELGLELDVARDAATRRAMLGSLPQLAVMPLARLHGKRLEAEDFDRLMVEDTPRNLLEWMNDSRSVRAAWDDARWSAFRSRCKAEYGFDPDADGELTAGERLGLRDGAWLGVWERFVEAPTLYSGLPDLLRRAKPAMLMLEGRESWPDLNDADERDLRKAFADAGKLNASEAREKVATLEAEHGARRRWVWARLGQCPLANALAHISALANHTASALGGDSPDAMASLYARSGYLADDAALRAFAEVRSAEDCEAVSAVVRAIYLPWAQDAAEHFQRLVAAHPFPSAGRDGASVVAADPGSCILFVDGLRFDVAQRLVALAEERSMRVVQQRRWAAAPTVTATAKPAVSPIAAGIAGGRLGEDFTPEVAGTGRALTTDRFRKLLGDAGYLFMTPSEVGTLWNPEARGWTEYGEFDHVGHNMQARLAARIDEEVERVIERLESLLVAGWRSVRVVTDHGWQLMPGGLPAVALPKYLTESRWARCAVIKASAHVSTPTAPWFWNAGEAFAFGPGVSCFGKGVEYAHGGISLQECVIPDLVVSLDTPVRDVVVQITDVQWLGLRCRVSVAPVGVPVTVDLRTKAGDPGSSIADPKLVDEVGRAALLVENDSLEGTTVVVVVADASGRVVAKMPTTVGGEG